MARLLTESAAAEHVGLPLAAFRAQVEAGTMPPPVPLASSGARAKRYYDRVALDRRLDQLSGLVETQATESGLGGIAWR